jgi:hypothetical protein
MMMKGRKKKKVGLLYLHGWNYLLTYNYVLGTIIRIMRQTDIVEGEN